MNTTPDPTDPIRIPGIPEDSRFAYEPEGRRIVPAADLAPGDQFLYRASHTAPFETVEVARVQPVYRPGSAEPTGVRLWAYRAGHRRSRVTPFLAGTFRPGERVEVA